MVVIVWAKGFWFPLVLVIPLNEVEEAVESFTGFLRIGTFLSSRAKVHLDQINIGLDKYTILQFLDLPLELIKELRRFGRFTMVEVKDKNAYVCVKLV